ncbi:MAG: hypothetical protein ACREH5_01485 [Candidatus Omnitrophota bacterium]
MPIAGLVSVLYLVACLIDRTAKPRFFFAWAFLGMITVSCVVSVSMGSLINVLIPAFAILAVLFGLGVELGLTRIGGVVSDTKRKLLEAAVYCACIGQLVLLLFNPFAWVPARIDEERTREFIAILRDVKGEVFAPMHGHLTALAGKGRFAHQIPIWFVLIGDEGPVKTGLMNEIKRAIAEKRFGAIVLPTPEIGVQGHRAHAYYYWWEAADIAAYYTRGYPEYDYRVAPWEMTWSEWHEYIYVPKGKHA